MSSAAEAEEGLTHFYHEKDVFDALSELLELNPWPDAQGVCSASSKAEVLLGKLEDMLDVYQEGPHILDPYLERMVSPLVERLQTTIGSIARAISECQPLQGGPAAARWDARLLYLLTKVRGYKTIVRYFPHQVADLSTLLSVLDPPSTLASKSSPLNAASWELRFVLILWLSLVCMIPFGLDRFDPATSPSAENSIPTVGRIEKIGMSYIGEPGKEREAAALLLARLMLRQDVSTTLLAPFLQRCNSIFEVSVSKGDEQEGNEASPFLVTGISQCLCEIVKLARPEQVQAKPNIMSELYRTVALLDGVDQQSTAGSGMIGGGSMQLMKFRCKFAGRLGLLLLSTRSGKGGRGAAVAEEDMPDEVEAIVQDLLEGLQNKDGVVRWSAAKHLARVASLLPPAYTPQITGAIFDLFSLNVSKRSSIQTDGTKPVDTVDLLAVDESTWHGACLALAEMLRQGLISEDSLENLISWSLEALHFEQRKGTRSIGSGVRDAAAYVFWSLARAFSSQCISNRGKLEEQALPLAHGLITAALFDREVQIRRAASAAFQESVGRLGVLPHGIQILQAANFFTVGLRRSAYLTAAPEVAMFSEYRKPLVNHLLKIGLGHWDSGIRTLSSQSLACVSATEPDIIPQLITTLSTNVGSKDANRVHGSLLALAEVAKLLPALALAYEGLLTEIFSATTRVPDNLLNLYSSNPILSAVSLVIKHSFSSKSALLVPGPPPWEKVLNLALKRSDDGLHAALAGAFEAITLAGCGKEEASVLLDSLKTGTPLAKQAASCCLGGIRLCHASEETGIARDAMSSLVAVLKLSTGPAMPLECRRNAATSLASMVVGLGSRLEQVCSPEQFREIVQVITGGLEDYTTDERGDVGSWVRGACLEALGALCAHTVACCSTGEQEYFTPSLLRQIMGAMIKQCLDRIDGSRELAWKSMATCVTALAKLIPNNTSLASLTETFNPCHESKWRDLLWTFPRLLELLRKDNDYLVPVINGMIPLFGGLANSDARKALDTFVDFLQGLGAAGDPLHAAIAGQIVRVAKENAKSPKLVLMALDFVASLLEADCLDALGESEEGNQTLHGLRGVAMRGLERSKVIARRSAAAKVVAHLTAFERQRSPVLLSNIAMLLAHRMPKVRVVMAESLFNRLALEGNAPEAEVLLSETIWLVDDYSVVKEKAGEVTTALEMVWAGS